MCVPSFRRGCPASPLAEGRELKFDEYQTQIDATQSPLAEGRELKYKRKAEPLTALLSPLAEGRELKYGSAG